MNKNKKLVLIISVAAVCLAFLAFGVKFIFDTSYRSNIAEIPDFSTISKPLQEQILKADRKARFNPSSDNLGNLGMVYHSGNEYEKAAICYKLAISRDKKKWIWSYYLGHLNQEQGAYKNSIENFNAVLEHDPMNKMAVFYLGEAYQNLNNTVEAEKLFNKVASIKDQKADKKEAVRENYFPLRTYALFNLSRLLMNAGRLDDTEKMLKKIIDEQIQFGPAYRMLGSVYAAKDDTTMSKHYMIRAKDLAEFMAPVDLFVDDLILTSRSGDFLMKEIDVAVYNNNLKWALVLCDHALKYIPANKFLFSKALKTYLAIGSKKQVLALVDKHYNFYNSDFSELMNLADLLFEKGFKMEALKYFNQARKLKPQSISLTIWLGKRGYTNNAYSLMNEQLEKDPDNSEYLSNAVMISMDRGEKDNAIRYLEKLKKLSPSNLDVKRYEGYFAEEEGKQNDAIALWQEVLKEDPKDRYIIGKLNSIYHKQKDWDKNYLHLKQSLQSNPNDPSLLDELGKLLFYCPDQRIRNVAESREYLERAFINIGSDFDTRISAASNLSKVYAELKDNQNAQYYKNIALNMVKGKM